VAVQGSRLDGVYGAASPEEIAERYDAWASDYEAEMARAGYRHPAIAIALLCRWLPRGAAPVLDAGAGTGLVGQWLALLGFPVVEGLDISAGMLAEAARKEVYAALHKGALGSALAFEDARFAAVISTGVFTTGHVGAEALPELLRVTRRGGILVLTVKDDLWHGSFAAALGDLAAAGKLRPLEETPTYVSMPGVPGAGPGRAIALERL
jgi:predicted TPR repeat methyltransferase